MSNVAVHDPVMKPSGIKVSGTGYKVFLKINNKYYSLSFAEYIETDGIVKWDDQIYLKGAQPDNFNKGFKFHLYKSQCEACLDYYKTIGWGGSIKYAGEMVVKEIKYNWGIQEKNCVLFDPLIMRIALCKEFQIIDK